MSPSTLEVLRIALALLGALGSGLVGGLFFGFSVSVMPALGEQPPSAGIAAMQAINRIILRPAFLGPFLGTGAACAALVVVSFFEWGPGAPWLVLGGALYVLGSLLVTIVCNVPRNEALDKVDSARKEGARLWSAYLAGWTAWNHVRAAASLLATFAILLGLVLGASPRG